MEKKEKVIAKLSDFQKNDENPFLTQAIEKIEKNMVKKLRSSVPNERKAVSVYADVDTGEVITTSFIRQIEVDEQKFAKLYLESFSSFFELSNTAVRIFLFLMTCMKPINDMIFFDIKKCKVFTKYKTNKPIYKGLAELVNAQIIARGPSINIWFVNPMVAFNGDRVTFAKTFVRKKKVNYKDDRQLELFDQN